MNPNVYPGDFKQWAKNAVSWRSAWIIDCSRCPCQSLGVEKRHRDLNIFITWRMIWLYSLCTSYMDQHIVNFAILPYCKTMTTQGWNEHINAFIKAHPSPSLGTKWGAQFGFVLPWHIGNQKSTCNFLLTMKNQWSTKNTQTVIAPLFWQPHNTENER